MIEVGAVGGATFAIVDEASAVQGTDDIVLTSEMVEAGEDVIMSEVGGCSELSGYFSAAEVAKRVFVAMYAQGLSRPDSLLRHGQRVR
jgi:hypothetical protein